MIILDPFLNLDHQTYYQAQKCGSDNQCSYSHGAKIIKKPILKAKIFLNSFMHLGIY
jgi:hypothetical protein